MLLITNYDELGRAVKIINPDGSIFQTVYNANGTVQKEIDPKNTEVSYAYDKLGRVVEISHPFEEIDGTIYNSKTKTTYDNDGRVLYTETLRNLPGQAEIYAKTEYFYNGLGLIDAIIVYDANTVESITQYYYDAEGRKLRMYTGLIESLTISGLDVVSGKDTSYSVTKYEYDHNGQVTKLINPVGYETTFEYDKNGKLIKSVDPEGTVFNYVYDLNGNRLREYTVTLDSEGEIDYSYTYDSLGNRLTMIDSSKTTIYSYNKKGQLVEESDTLGSEKTYSYDLSGNRASMLVTFNNNTVQDVSYNYDSMGRLTEVLENNIVKAIYTYDINGNRTSLTYDNGTFTDYTYNLENSLKTISNYRGQNVISGETYTYYLSGNIFEKVDQSGRKTSYIYDDSGRLETEIVTQNDSETIRINYLYNDYNNRIAKQVITPTETYSIMYFYDEMNRLESTYSSKDGMTTYTYDMNGNTLSSVSPTETIAYEYNSLNELELVEKDNKISSYAYDGNRLRITKTVDGTTLQFLNDSDSVIAEILGTDVTASYLRGINLIAKSNHQGEFEWYYHYNYHGDVTEVTDISGTIVKTYKFDAFGIEENINATDSNPFRYTGEYFDKETGTIYLRARYYSPGLGRFINQDSYLGNSNDPLSLNLYTYTNNNPIMGIDPSGHDAEAVLGGIAVALYFVDGPLPIGDIFGTIILGGLIVHGNNIDRSNGILETPISTGNKTSITTTPIYDDYKPTAWGTDIDKYTPSFAGGMPIYDKSKNEIVPGTAVQQKSFSDYIYTANKIDYREVFFKQNPSLRGQVIVHHGIEQQVLTNPNYKDLFTYEEIHSYDNLRGIPKSINSDLHLSKIRKEWNKFYQQNPNATKQDFTTKRNEIDKKYGNQFNPQK